MKKINTKYNIKEDTLSFIAGEEMSLEVLSLKSDISLRTLNTILDTNIASEESLDNIYSFFFKNKYRLNEIKEELYKETNKEIILFHGSKKGLNILKKDGTRSDCDFGKGFYLSENYNQARMFMFNYPNSSVYIFKANLKGLRTLELECNLDWLIAINYYRGNIREYINSKKVKTIINKIENADVIIAPIADNRMFYILQEFALGNINHEVAIHSLSSLSLGKQYVFKTDKAIQKLIPLDRLYISSEERKEIQNELIKRSEIIDSKLKISKREFDRKGKYIDELF